MSKTSIKLLKERFTEYQNGFDQLKPGTILKVTFKNNFGLDPVSPPPTQEVIVVEVSPGFVMKSQQGAFSLKPAERILVINAFGMQCLLSQFSSWEIVEDGVDRVL